MSAHDVEKQFKLAQNFFTKTVLVIANARLHPEELGGAQRATNRWFNLELPAVDSLQDKLRPWRASSAALEESPPPMVVEVYLDASRLTPSQHVVLPESSLETREEIILERWVVQCEPLADGETPLTDLPAIYKRGISSMRSLYTMARLLPTWTLRQRLVRQRIASIPLRLGVRVNQGSLLDLSSNGLDLSDQISGDVCTIAKFGIEPITTPVGRLTLRASYRNEVAFRVTDASSGGQDDLLEQFLELPERRPLKPVLSFTRPFNDRTRNEAPGARARQASARKLSAASANRLSASPLDPDGPPARQQAELADFVAFIDETRGRVAGSLAACAVQPLDALDKYKQMQTSNLVLSNSITRGARRRSSDLRSRLGFYKDSSADSEIDRTILHGLTKMNDK